jgi:hypothetical protein
VHHRAFTFLISARPGADLRIALLPFLQTKTKYTALTMWPVWAREFGLKTGVMEYYDFGMRIADNLLAPQRRKERKANLMKIH